MLQFVANNYGNSRENLLLEVHESFDKVIELPVTHNKLTSQDSVVLGPVLNHLATALKKENMLQGSKRKDADAELIWEKEMRRLMPMMDLPMHYNDYEWRNRYYLPC